MPMDYHNYGTFNFDLIMDSWMKYNLTFNIFRGAIRANILHWYDYKWKGHTNLYGLGSSFSSKKKHQN